MKHYVIINRDRDIISRHKTVVLANAKLRKIDSVHSSLHATDVDWLKNDEEALQGYDYCVDYA